ncbi:MAG: hypothetical protein ACOCZ5_00475 [bacterium]
MDFGFGCIGIGQGGINIAEQFAPHFKTIAIDTASQNLDNCNNIKKNLRYHAEVNKLGGAGKNIQIGEKAIIQHEEEIINLLNMNGLFDMDYVFVNFGLGGGSGTLGGVQVSRILSERGVEHGMLCTLPTNYEGSDEQINASVGLYAIEELRKQTDYLRSVVIVENEILKEKVMTKDIPFENLWIEANNYVFNSFFDVLKFTQQSSSFTIDGQDYIKVLKKKGYIVFGSCLVSDIENKTETALFSEVKESIEDNIFVKDLNYNTAKGLALIINRPERLNDSKAIENLFTQMRKFIGTGTFANGIYSGEQGLLSKAKNIIDKKPLEILTVISGMAFPKERYNELKENAEKEIQNYEEKSSESKLDIDISKISNYINDSSTKKEKINFSIFNKNQKKEERKTVKSINWDKIGKSGVK